MHELVYILHMHAREYLIIYIFTMFKLIFSTKATQEMQEVLQILSGLVPSQSMPAVCSFSEQQFTSLAHSSSMSALAVLYI